MRKRLVLLGGGHAHLLTLANLKRFTDDGFEAIVVQPSSYHYYSGMGPGMLGSTYRPDQVRFDTRRQVERCGGRFIENTAVHIDPAGRSVALADGSTISYDVLSCNTGSYVAADIPHHDGWVIPAKPISGLIRAGRHITDLCRKGPVHIGIVGGGPSAVELAGNVRQLADIHGTGQVRITLFAGSRVFPGRPERLRRTVDRYLEKRCVTVREACRARTVANGVITTDRNERVTCDLIFIATGVSPSPLFRQSGLSTDSGSGLAVNEYLQSIAYGNIFGGGDCIDFVERPLDRVGVYAVRQNPVLLHNLEASLKGGALQRFSPGGGYLLIYNMGKGQAILVKGSLILSGRLAFRLKDYIDRRFMRTYRL